MKRFLFTCCLLLLPALSWAQSALTEPAQAEALCDAEKTSNAVSDDALERIRKVELTFRQASLLGFDRSTGLLPLNIYKDIDLMEGFSLRITEPTGVAFELTEEQAADLVARYDSGIYRIEVEFVPSSYVDQTTSTCAEKKNRQVILATLLSAAVLDENGTAVSRFETEQSRNIRLRKAQSLKAYLSDATPKVEVVALLAKNGKETVPIEPAVERASSQLLAQSLLGCYSQALVENKRLQGAVVVSLNVEKRTARVLVTTVENDKLLDCLKQKALSQLEQLPEHLTAKTIKFNAVLKLVDGGSL